MQTIVESISALFVCICIAAVSLLASCGQADQPAEGSRTALSKDCGDGEDAGPRMVVIGVELAASVEEPSQGASISPAGDLRPFAIARCEVTVSEYRQFVVATGWAGNANDEAERQRACFGWNEDLDTYDLSSSRNWRNPGFAQSDDEPVVCVSWHDAKAYATWLSAATGQQYRLPTNIEWEYAARGISSTRYSWGDEVGTNIANCSGCGSRWDDRQTAPVGSFDSNSFGLYDMHGNVSEWTNECRFPIFSGADEELRLDDNCASVSVRGGSWSSPPDSLDAGVRDDYVPIFASDNIGFRVVRELPSLSIRQSQLEQGEQPILDANQSPVELPSLDRGQSQVEQPIPAVEDSVVEDNDE